MSHCPGWQVYQYWQQGNNVCFLCNILSGGYAQGYVSALLLPTNTTAAQLFKSLNDYISGKLNWSFCVRIYSNRVADMTGQLSGFTPQVKEISSEYESTYSIIHREMLANQKMSPEHNSVLQDVNKMITLKYLRLIHVCSHNSVRRWTQSTHIFSHTQKRGGFLKVGHWSELLSYESHSRDFF